MSCTSNHNDTSKKFCPECGAKMSTNLITQLNTVLKEVLEENKWQTFDFDKKEHTSKLYETLLKNNVQLQGKIVYYDNAFHEMKQFMEKYSFMTETNLKQNGMFIVPINFDEAKKQYERAIPNDVSCSAKLFLNDLYDFCDKKRPYDADRRVIIKSLTEYFGKVNMKPAPKYSFKEYLLYVLQYIIKKQEGDAIYITAYNKLDENGEKFMIDDLYNENQLFIIRSGWKLYLRFSGEHVFDFGDHGYMGFRNLVPKASKEEAKEWFEKCATLPQWVRNKELEDKFITEMQT